MHLPDALWEGETVHHLATGSYGDGIGLVAMTSMRLLFLRHGVLSQRLEDFPYGRVSSVQWSTGVFNGTLTVFASGNRAKIEQVPKEEGKRLADALRLHLAQGAAPRGAGAGSKPRARNSAAAAPVSSAEARDVASRLRTLDELLAAGAVTDAEYRERRKAILDSL